MRPGSTIRSLENDALREWAPTSRARSKQTSGGAAMNVSMTMRARMDYFGGGVVVPEFFLLFLPPL